jgi:MoxR-like ATPase
MPGSVTEPHSVDDTLSLLAGEGYLADRRLGVVVHLALSLQRPLLLEGEAGVGKTEVARALGIGEGAVKVAVHRLRHPVQSPLDCHPVPGMPHDRRALGGT